jgi:uncharacterized membrane protein YeaQ/YmgE (transglycosylase-associated protein family)
MTPAAQMIIAMAIIGLVIGGIATLAVRGRGLITYVIAGIVGSFIGGLWLLKAIGLLFSDPFIQILFGAPIGAIILVILARLDDRSPR